MNEIKLSYAMRQRLQRLARAPMTTTGIEPTNCALERRGLAHPTRIPNGCGHYEWKITEAGRRFL